MWQRFGKVHGYKLERALVTRLIEHPEFRRDLVNGPIRSGAWWARNSRWLDDEGAPAAIVRMIEAFELLHRAGVPMLVLSMLLNCVGGRCVCSGCRLFNGDELVSLRLRAGPVGTYQRLKRVSS